MNLLTLTGPSCSGKTTLANKLIAEHNYASIVSHTTRPPRPGEVEGVDYYFCTDYEFNNSKFQNEFVETISFNGAQYGVSATELKRVSDTGRNLVLVVDPHGLGQITQYYKGNADVKIFSVYIHGEVNVLITRYLTRLAGEDLANPKTASRHAARILSLTNEVKEWYPSGVYDERYNEIISGIRNSEELARVVRWITEDGFK